MRLKDKVLKYFNKGQIHFKSFGALIASMADRLDEDVKDVSSCINKLIADGVICESGKRSLTLSNNLGMFVGEICGNAKGYAFVKPYDNNKEDCFIAAKDLHGALDNDKVLYKVLGDHAEVVKILKRTNTSIVGTICDEKSIKDRHKKSKSKGKFVIADNDKFSKPIFIPERELHTAAVGDKVVVDITYQPESNSEVPSGRVMSVLNGNDVENAIESVLVEKNIPKSFSKETIDEAEGLKIDWEKEKSKRVDLTNKVIFTIDGADAKDLDDAISIEKTNDGYELGVHIADVGNFVVRDSALDEEAFYRATSVYFPNKVYPMLPKRLSNDLCSLNANESKLALSVVMTLDNNGNVKKYRIFESIIKSTQRLTYDQAYACLNGEKDSGVKSEVAEALFVMIKLSEILSDKRTNAGALDFDIAECEFEFDENGNVVDVKRRERNQSHKLIENFMVLCNETVARCFAALEMPFVYRVHECPIKTKFDEVVGIINGLGAKLKFEKKITPIYVQNILKNLEKEEYYDIASKLILRALEKAVYSPDCDGHFGLALDYYCHFTSPIRRYPDLTIHRIIKSILKYNDDFIIKSEQLNILKGKIKSLNQYELEEFVYDASMRSSERERNADEAEREVDDIYRAKIMSAHIGEVFDARVSGVANFGVFVELENTAEGLIKLELLPEDDYNYDAKKLCLMGKHHKYKIGDSIKVKTLAASPTLRRIDFAPAD